MAIDENALLEYACDKFEQEAYDEALEAFVLLYSKGYEKDWVLETIYNCYMKGNEWEFRHTYDSLTEKDDLSYEECTFDFIPYKEGEYYIFDKKESFFRGIFSVKEIEGADLDSELQKMEFSAVALEVDGNWSDHKHVLTDAKNRKMYVICEDLKRIFSYYKIPEFAEYMRNIMFFSKWEEFQEYFHKNTSIYLPKIFYGTQVGSKIFYQIIEEEHTYRLTPEGRNTDNVLLSIAIPTANRGHLLLKRIEHLVQMQYDSEIEIVISKNGVKFGEEEYKRVEQIQDSRINYFDHRCDLKYIVNWSYAIEMSHGKYVLFVSDEDDVILESLEHYLRLLYECHDLGVLRAKTTLQFSMINERKYGKKGIEAFRLEFLLQNYISGLIVKRVLFIEENLLELERFSENSFYFYYPHEWWCAMLSMRGGYMQEPVFLVAEGDSVMVEEIKRDRAIGIIGKEDGIVGNTELPQYATYEARLEQFQGQIEFLKWFCKGDAEIYTVGLQRAIYRTAHLLKLARNYNYDCDNYLMMVEQYAELCMEAVEEAKLSNSNKKQLLLYLNNCIKNVSDHHERLSSSPDKEISECVKS